MNKTLRNILAVCIAVLPINIVMIWYRITQTENFTINEMTLYPLLFGGGSIILILLLNKFLVKDSFKTTFNAGEGNWLHDIFIGLGLTILFFAMFFLERVTLMQWIPRSTPPNTELVDAMIELANNPILMVIWFGPVLWIGIALFEELSRLFLLKCLWNTNEGRNWQILVIFLTSTLIGATHMYQGLAGSISIGIKSIIMCLYFYKYRRLLPLVISHGLYDGIQFAFFVVQFQQ